VSESTQRGVLCSTVLAVCWSCLTGGVYAAPEQSGALALNVDAAIKLSQAAVGKTVGEYTLINIEGQPVRLSSYRGKPLLVNFIYTGCFQVCPTATRTLKRSFEAAQSALGTDSFRAVSIGFNLPFDTPDALRAFARQQAADRHGWDFLSPQAASLEALTRDFGFTYQPSPRGFDHLLQITVVDAEGRIYRQIYGDDFAVPQVVGPLRELITGARRENESLSGFFDRVRILCTVYDPASGTYRIKSSILFELAGGLLGLIAMGWFFWRELQRSRAA
jgi:protein SCO1/2